jgi:hypothetical protein
MHKLAHPNGKVATSRAAAATGISMVLSSYSTCSIEDVTAQGLQNPYAMQICVLKDRTITLQLLKRAEGMFTVKYMFTYYSLAFALIKSHSQTVAVKPFSYLLTMPFWESGSTSFGITLNCRLI